MLAEDQLSSVSEALEIFDCDGTDKVEVTDVQHRLPHHNVPTVLLSSLLVVDPILETQEVSKWWTVSVAVRERWGRSWHSTCLPEPIVLGHVEVDCRQGARQHRQRQRSEDPLHYGPKRWENHTDHGESEAARTSSARCTRSGLHRWTDPPSRHRRRRLIRGASLRARSNKDRSVCMSSAKALRHVMHSVFWRAPGYRACAELVTLPSCVTIHAGHSPRCEM